MIFPDNPNQSADFNEEALVLPSSVISAVTSSEEITTEQELSNQLPKISIVGRPNVGKSSLLNFLSGKRISIVDPTAGVTRDRVSQIVHHEGRFYEFTDTGGVGIQEELTADVEKQIGYALECAEIVLFVVDARTGAHPLDEQVAERLRKIQKPILLVVNKCDNNDFALNANDFHRLGYQPIIPMSAEQRKGKNQLFKEINQRLADKYSTISPTTPAVEIAIVGRRNVGKSTFINQLAQAERVIVSEIPGTTRDSIDVRFERDGKTFVAIDTAGVRNKSSLADNIEFYSMARAERSIRRAGVVLHFFDARLRISKVDKQLTDYILKHHKPAIFVINKWDLVKDLATTEDFGTYIRKTFPMLDYIPIAFITAKSGKNVYKLLNLAQNLFKQGEYRVGTGELNRLLEHAITRQPPPTVSNRLPKIFYATQIGSNPPHIVLFCNNPQLFEEHYRRYLLKSFREALPFADVPIHLEFRSRHSDSIPNELNTEDDTVVENIDESEINQSPAHAAGVSNKIEKEVEIKGGSRSKRKSSSNLDPQSEEIDYSNDKNKDELNKKGSAKKDRKKSDDQPRLWKL